MAHHTPLVSPITTSATPTITPVSSAFALFGLIFGVWQVLLPDLQQALQLSEGALGSAITIGFLAAFPVMVLGGRLADRLGPYRLIAGTALLMGLAYIGLAVVGAYWQLVVILLLFFGGSGAYDVGINAAAIQVEQAGRRHLLPYVHAAFSAAAALSALLSGVLLAVGVPFRAIYVLVAAAALTLSGIAWWRAMRQPLPNVPEHAQRASLIGSLALLRVPAILLLALIAALTALSEGTLQTWSAIYLRSTLGLPVILGAAGPAIIHLAMLVGRLLTGYLSRRVGRRGVLTLAGGCSAGAVLLALATANPLLTLLGFLIAGIALAGVAPVAFSLAGDHAPQQSGAVSSAITVISYSGFLLGPALIGGLAELFSLRLALASLILIGVLILGLSLFVREALHLRHTTRSE